MAIQTHESGRQSAARGKAWAKLVARAIGARMTSDRAAPGSMLGRDR
jgi:hypothetical protein